MECSFILPTASVSSDDTVMEVLALMQSSQPPLTCVFVAHGTQLQGIFTESDLVSVVMQGQLPHDGNCFASLTELKITDVMTTPVISIRVSELNDISIPVTLLQQHQIRYLAVVDEQESLIGVITPESLQPQLWQMLQLQRTQFIHQQEIESSLRKSEAKYQSLLHALPDFVMRTSGDGIYLERAFSPTFDSYSGDDELIGKTLHDSLPTDLADLRLSYIQQALQTGELQIYEQQIVIKGELRTEEVRITTCGENEVFVIVRDVTDRKVVENAFYGSEATNRALIRAIPDLLIRVNQQGEFLDLLSGGSVKKVLLPASHVHHATAYDILPDAVANQRSQAIQRAFETGMLQTYEQQIELDGEMCWEEVQVSQIDDTQALVVIRDITERKRAEIELQQLNQELEARIEQRTAALRESEERWQLALEGSNASLWDWNVRTNKTFRSNRWRELRGLSEHELEGTQEEWIEQIHPDDRDRVLSAFADHLAQKTPFYQEEYRLQRQDGTYIWVLDRGQALWDETGNPVRIIGSEMDITRRKEAELETQLLRERLQFVLSSSPAVIFTCRPDDDYAITFVSDNIATLSGYTAEEFLSNSNFWANHIHSEDAPQILANLPLLFERGRHIHEYRLLHKAGHYQWVRSELRLVRDEQGEPIEIVGYIADISEQQAALQERKQVEEQLRKNETHLSAAQRIAQLGSWEFDLQTNEVVWSQETYQIFGRPLDEGNPTYSQFRQYVHPDDLPRVEQAIWMVLENGQPFESEYRLCRSDGSVRYVLARAELLLGTTGRPVTLVGTVLDISDRKQLELNLQTSQTKLINVLNSANAGIIGSRLFSNEDFEYDYCSQGCETVFGYTQAELMANKALWLTRVLPEDMPTITSWIRNVVMGHPPRTYDYRFFHKDGRLRWMSATYTANRETEDCWTITAVHVDVTERKLAEEQLQDINERLSLTNAELDRATRLKDEFLANMSHELRTPLNAILGMSEGLQEGVFVPLNDRQKRAVETIERSGRHLLELINDILDLSKIEAGKLELQVAPVDIRYLCETSLSFVRQQAIAKNIRLSIENPQVPPDIVIDERRIRQVLINLLSNAIKFTPDGGQVQLIVQIDQQSRDAFLKLSVRDTGIGIAEADIPKIFQPFVQIDSRLNRQYTGTGLGLSLVRQLAELHGGTVSVTSQLHQGSCFTVCLPYLTETSVNFPVPSVSDSTPPDPSNMRVLVIEDSSAAA